jgi:hypothetical protein
MYKITLEWIEGDRTRSQTISDQDNTKEVGNIFIGRDEIQSDVVLPSSEKTVSRLHVVIFYDSQRKGLFLKNVTSNKSSPNPAIVDGKIIISEEVLLSHGSIIKLGNLTLRITYLEIIIPKYGVQCVNCKREIPYDYIGDFCPHCGYSLQANQTIYLQGHEIPPENQDT